MEKKQVVIDSPIAVAGLTIIPVVHVSLNYFLHNDGGSVLGVKQPVAIMVVSPTEKRAFRITGEEVSIDQLVQEATDIKETESTKS